MQSIDICIRLFSSAKIYNNDIGDLQKIKNKF